MTIQFRPSVFPVHERGSEKPAFCLTCESCGSLVENSKDGIDGHDAFHRGLEQTYAAADSANLRTRRIN